MGPLLETENRNPKWGTYFSSHGYPGVESKVLKKILDFSVGKSSAERQGLIDKIPVRFEDESTLPTTAMVVFCSLGPQ